MIGTITADERPARQGTKTTPLSIPGYRHIQDIQALNCLTGNGNYTWVEFVGEKKPVLVSQTLKHFERQLPDFIRVSKSVLLNPNYVVGTMREDARTVYLRLADERLVLISRRRLAETIDKLGKGTSLKPNF